MVVASMENFNTCMVYAQDTFSDGLAGNDEGRLIK